MPALFVGMQPILVPLLLRCLVWLGKSTLLLALTDSNGKAKSRDGNALAVLDIVDEGLQMVAKCTGDSPRLPFLTCR